MHERMIYRSPVRMSEPPHATATPSRSRPRALAEPMRLLAEVGALDTADGQVGSS
jgi:hypothetical protein